MLSLALPLLLAFVPLHADKAAHSVTFTARATDVTAGTTVEFAIVGPDSDRAYEAMFVTDARIADIARAFDEAGIPRGRAVHPSACRFWPVGKGVALTPAIWDYIADDDKVRPTRLRYTGGLRDDAGAPVADTNMPCAVFALYSLDQSLLLMDETSDQSQAYGLFKCTGKAKEGERIAFTVTWDGAAGTASRRLPLVPGQVRTALESLKGADSDLDILPVFDAEMSVEEARAAASALAVIDSAAVKINGFEKGQFYYKGFLPDEKWRDRKKRLTQPLEVRVGATNATCTVIDENWEVEGLDPELTPHEMPVAQAASRFKGDTCLFYVGKGVRLSRLYALMKQLPSTIRNWYVYVD